MLDLERNQLDVDAGEVVGQRSPSARLLALVRPDPLRRDELQGPVLREQRLEEGQRELPIVRGDAFGLLAQEPLLELRVVFPQLLVEGLVLIAGADGSGEGLFELGHACEEVVRHCRHAAVIADHA